MIKIANIIPDDKFIDGLMEYHDAVGGDVIHEYIFIRRGLNVEFNYIKNQDRIRVSDRFRFIRTLKDENYDAVFLHSLYSAPLDLIPIIPKGIKVFWFAWGFDIYDSNRGYSLIEKECYGEETKAIIEIKDKRELWSKKARVFLKKNIFKDYLEKRYARAVSRIDFFSGVLPVEYDMIPKGKYGFKAKQVQYNYVSINRIRKRNLTEKSVNILVGNSATPENNHVEVFKKLSNIDLHNCKVFAPLSYGDPLYRDVIMEEGKKYLGENFSPIVDFMPFDQYKQIIDTCGIVILNHERQQAIGNLTLAFENGAKVFLSETSVAYNYYRSVGYVIHTVQKDLDANSLFPETEENINNNFELLAETKREDYIERLKKLYKIIENQ